jgi:hypothetical protein
MNFMRCFLIILALLINSTALRSAQKQPESVSIIRLIATPEKYQGKFVRIEGYLHNQFEDSAIYLSKDDADHLINKNALWVRYAEKAQKQALYSEQEPDNLRYFDRKYVLIEGVFNEYDHGHLGAYAGSIKKVTRIMELTR